MKGKHTTRRQKSTSTAYPNSSTAGQAIVDTNSPDPVKNLSIAGKAVSNLANLWVKYRQRLHASKNPYHEQPQSDLTDTAPEKRDFKPIRKYVFDRAISLMTYRIAEDFFLQEKIRAGIPFKLVQPCSAGLMYSKFEGLKPISESEAIFVEDGRIGVYRQCLVQSYLIQNESGIKFPNAQVINILVESEQINNLNLLNFLVCKEIEVKMCKKIYENGKFKCKYKDDEFDLLEVPQHLFATASTQG